MADSSNSDTSALRRRSRRMNGPFDGRRMGPLTAPVRIHDLSVGGCLIESHHEVAIGRRFRLQIDLPGEGWISLEAETLHEREHHGFAVGFIDLDEANRGRIERTIARVLEGSPEDGWSFNGI